MGYFLEGFKHRVNNNAINYTEERAGLVIKSYLLGDNKFKVLSDLAQKELLLRAVKVLMANDLGIKPDAVRFLVVPLGKSVGASILRSKGDGTFTIAINEREISQVSTETFLLAILHEYGHLDLILRECKGENVPKALFTDSFSREKINWWQKCGYLFKYASDDNEFYANMFAIDKARKMMGECEEQKHKDIPMNKLKKICNKDYFETKLAYIEAGLFRAGWVGISKILRIQENDCASLEPCSSGFIEIAMNINQILEEQGLRESEKDASIYVFHINEILRECVINGEPVPKYNESVKMVYTSYCCMLLAGTLGLDKDMLSHCYDGNQEEKVKFINTSTFRKNSPLYGYFCFNKEFFEDCDMGQFVDVLTKEIIKVKNENKKAIEKTAEENIPT